MIVVDSSVWIDHLNGSPGREVDRLRAVLADPTVPVIVGDLVLFEVLAGLRSARMADEVRDLLGSLELVGMVGPELATTAAANFRRLRTAGITVRSVDLLIASFCVATGATLLTRDRDFDRLVEPLGLSLERP